MSEDEVSLSIDLGDLSMIRDRRYSVGPSENYPAAPIAHLPASFPALSNLMRRSALFPLVAVLCAISSTTSLSVAQQGPPRVTVAEVQLRDDIPGGRSFVGTFEGRRHSSIGSAVAGRVVKMVAREGDRVAKGDALAKLLTRNLEIQIRAARAELDLRSQELLELKNGSREEEKRQAENRMKAAEASMKFAKTKLARTKELFGRNASTQNQFEDDTAAADVAIDTYLATQATYDLVMAGPRPERIAQGEARAHAAEEEVNRLLDLLEKHTIVAPFDGFVVAEHTEDGQWIESGRLVAEVVEVDPIELRVPVQESYVARLKVGDQARIEVEALPALNLVGKVSAIVPMADPKSRSFPVKVSLENHNNEDGVPLLKPGMFARVWLPVDHKTQALVVPKDSLVLGGPQPVVIVVEQDPKDQKFKARPVVVQLGVAADSWIEVRGDLKAGQQVVVEGNERLRPGTEVNAVLQKVQEPKTAAAKPPSKTADPETSKDPAPKSAPRLPELNAE